MLLVRPDHLGDVLFVGPALNRLASIRPDLEITLAVGPWSEEVAGLLPGEHRLRLLRFPWFDRRPKPPVWAPYARLWTEVRALRRQPYDAAVILRDDDWWSAWLVQAAGIPIRAGHDHRSVRGFLTHVLDSAPAHTAARNIALAAALVGDHREPSPGLDPLRIRSDSTLSSDARSRAGRATPVLMGAEGSDLVAIHAGAGAEIKRWTPSSWQKLESALPAGMTLLLTGGAGEAHLVQSTADALRGPTINLCGQTSLGELAQVFRQCRLVVGPDSGPLHLAVAAGVPTVHLFGPASSERFGPWGDPARHRVVLADAPCAPCGRLDWGDPRDHPCVRLIASDRVAAEVRAALGLGRL